ncbi:hypothetical protein KLQU111852_24280 [Klebsiella quasipneumoniae subsp. quasipneumoniae]|nr:Uncharacterised protein [Klebsiella variicola]VGP66341.1 hypothetical protein SB01124_05380 [Klebsiella quasipneumoniae subsp. quasipneumoniae]
MVNVDTSGAIGLKVFIHLKPLYANKARVFGPIAINKYRTNGSSIIVLLKRMIKCINHIVRRYTILIH